MPKPVTAKTHDVALEGGCMCGAVRFRSEGPWRDIALCHCSQCRKTSGHFWAASATPTVALEIEEDGDLVWYKSSDAAERGFCAACGSSLFYRRFGTDMTSVGAGCLASTGPLAAYRHIFTADKGDYYAITDDIPQFEVY